MSAGWCPACHAALVLADATAAKWASLRVTKSSKLELDAEAVATVAYRKVQGNHVVGCLNVGVSISGDFTYMPGGPYKERP